MQFLFSNLVILQHEPGHSGKPTLIDSLDARYKSDPNMSKMVTNLENQYKKNMDRLEKAERLKQEAKDLENRVHTK